MEKWWLWLKKWFSTGPGGTNRAQVLRWLLILGLIGVILMILNSFLKVKEFDLDSGGTPFPGADGSVQQTFIGGNTSNEEESKFKDIELAYERRLKQILENIAGVGDVQVLVTIESTEELVLEKNMRESSQVTNEKDTNAASRNITEVTRSGEVVLYQISGNQNPLVLKYIKPKIRGVVVVAKGAENITVKKMLSEAVERGLDVPPHRISVLPRKQQ